MSTNQMTFDDVCANRHRGNPESVRANPRADAKARDKAAIFAALECAGDAGLTCDELEVCTGLSHQTCSARCTELKAAGYVAPKPVGFAGYERRRTRTGKLAAVLVIKS